MTKEPATGEARAALSGLIATFAVTAVWWALALWPVADSPEWLARTRYVCFGVNETGLPDAGGWIGLIAGPIGMLIIVIVGWWSGVRELIRRARHSAALAAVLSALVVGAIALVAGTTWRVRQAHAQQIENVGPETLPPATYPRLNEVAPKLHLTAHDGKQIQLESLRGRTVFLTFAFAHCTTICPVIVRDVLTAQRQTANSAALVVTLDPWRDTPARLESMARDWGFPADNAWMLGGTVAEVEATLQAWQVPYQRDELTGDVIHPSLAYIIDRDGRIAFAATGGAETLTALARRLQTND